MEKHGGDRMRPGARFSIAHGGKGRVSGHWRGSVAGLEVAYMTELGASRSRFTRAMRRAWFHPLHPGPLPFPLSLASMAAGGGFMGCSLDHAAAGEFGPV